MLGDATLLYITISSNCYFCSLQNIPKNIRERVPLICYIEDKLYDMYLPLKFYVKGRLDISDKLESGFYLIDGIWKKQFPFLTTLLCEPLTTDFTVYTVDYSYGAYISSNSKEMLSSQQEEKNFIVSENVLDRKESISKIVRDKCLPGLILSAFKTM